MNEHDELECECDGEVKDAVMDLLSQYGEHAIAQMQKAVEAFEEGEAEKQNEGHQLNMLHALKAWGEEKLGHKVVDATEFPEPNPMSEDSRERYLGRWLFTMRSANKENLEENPPERVECERILKEAGKDLLDEDGDCNLCGYELKDHII